MQNKRTHHVHSFPSLIKPSHLFLPQYILVLTSSNHYHSFLYTPHHSCSSTTPTPIRPPTDQANRIAEDPIKWFDSQGETEEDCGVM